MIDIQHISKAYLSATRETWAIGDVSFTVRKGEFVCIVGPSGCGKSTLLNMVGSFMAPSAGSIAIDRIPVVPGTIPHRLGYIFQKDTVLPWYTVGRNIGLGLKFRGHPEQKIAEKVRRLLALANLSGCEDMLPHQLSGGMRQRVALLMTLACEPDVLLLDEPFGALDSNTKMTLHHELLDIWQKLSQTVMMVTHDLDEAVTLADRVIVLSAPPSRVVLDHHVDLPRPRDVFALRDSEAFGRNVRAIWSVLGREFQAAQGASREVSHVA
ncbi:ABC transporter ATP-binding protein [Xenophilus sp. Marseille-Q4582]|uniref:ABC transporter ATP-binding protein n=1 Tax=Xenophilus sp. Marseille-Q4582 TaxID=2866600 RepID=UPI001CE42C50|nr:ABC transporter ATP-binding protein [Xenophilus sp. Marseille-Q4582]